MGKLPRISGGSGRNLIRNDAFRLEFHFNHFSISLNASVPELRSNS